MKKVLAATLVSLALLILVVPSVNACEEICATGTTPWGERYAFCLALVEDSGWAICIEVFRGDWSACLLDGKCINGFPIMSP